MYKMVSNANGAKVLPGLQLVPVLFYKIPRPIVRSVCNRFGSRASLHHVLGVEEHELEGGECKPSRIPC